MRELVPAVARAGVGVIAIEFGNASSQPKVDALLAKPEFDRELARQIALDFLYWYYEDDLQILKSVFDANRARPAGTPPLRLLLLASEDPVPRTSRWRA